MIHLLVYPRTLCGRHRVVFAFEVALKIKKQQNAKSRHTFLESHSKVSYNRK